MEEFFDVVKKTVNHSGEFLLSNLDEVREMDYKGEESKTSF